MIIAYLELEKLPKDCGYCPLNYDDMYCTAVKLPKGNGIRYDNVRPDWCPLGEVTLTTHTSKCVECLGGYCEEECGVPYVSPCVGCNGRICEICTEGKDHDEE